MTDDRPLRDIDPEARARALQSLLIEEGLATTDAVNEVISTYEEDVGPMVGARVVAEAWIDPAGTDTDADDGPTFAEPWQARAFALAVAATDEDGERPWETFQESLAEEVPDAESPIPTHLSTSRTTATSTTATGSRRWRGR